MGIDIGSMDLAKNDARRGQEARVDALYSVRSERQSREQLNYNLLLRWFLDIGMVKESFARTVFSHNRDGLIVLDAVGEFLRVIVAPFLA
jgi:transposase